jgi:hypothetical protein
MSAWQFSCNVVGIVRTIPYYNINTVKRHSSLEESVEICVCFIRLKPPIIKFSCAIIAEGALVPLWEWPVSRFFCNAINRSWNYAISFTSSYIFNTPFAFG